MPGMSPNSETFLLLSLCCLSFCYFFFSTAGRDFEKCWQTDVKVVQGGELGAGLGEGKEV